MISNLKNMWDCCRYDMLLIILFICYVQSVKYKITTHIIPQTRLSLTSW